MKRRNKLIALGLSVTCLSLSAGLYAGLVAGSTVPGAVTEGQTLAGDPSTMVDTAKAITLIDAGKSALCKTTITGVDYAANYGVYVGGYWYQGLSALRLAQAISPDKYRYDNADIALEQTTITGKKYCMNPSRWPSGQWATAFNALATQRADLVANPKTDGPSITVK